MPQHNQPHLLDDAPPPASCCGIDEVGRGALAGPLVAAGVILPEDIRERLGPLARFLRDSKTVPAQRRAEIAVALHEHALAVEIVTIRVALINKHGISWANREAFKRIIARIHTDEYVVDGILRPPNPADRTVTIRCLPKADDLVPAVSAASLVAKVYRDALMATLHRKHPHFGWESNAGYGSPAHLAALREHGPTAEHRTLFVTTALNGGQKAKRAAPAEAQELWGEGD